MRALLALAFVAVLAVGAYFLVATDDGETPELSDGSVTLVGDSLNVGIDPYLRGELAGWTVDAHDRVGRMTWEGIDELRRLRTSLAPIVVVSLGTNDADGTEREFRKLVFDAIGIVGPRRCLLWATIVRGGVARTGFNDVLQVARAEHPNLRLVDWAGMVEAEPDVLASDTVHGTPAGYERRAVETAVAARGCPGR